jgi:hypothetical protein
LSTQFQPGFGEISQEFRRLIEHPLNAKALTNIQFRQANRLRCGERAVCLGNGVAMRIAGGVIQKSIDPIDQQVADCVLHVLGFFVHFVPGQLQRLREEQLD